MQDRSGLIHEIIATAAVYLPLVAKDFICRKNLLHDQPGLVARQDAGALRTAGLKLRAQPMAIIKRPGQSVDMIDPQAIYHPLGIETQGQLVDRIEHLGQLHADTYQLVDLEKSPPVDAICCATPPGEAVVLSFQQGMQALASIGLPAVIMLAGYRGVHACKPQRIRRNRIAHAASLYLYI